VSKRDLGYHRSPVDAAQPETRRCAESPRQSIGSVRERQVSVDSNVPEHAPEIVRTLLHTVFDGRPDGGDNAFTAAGMSMSELVVLYGLAYTAGDALEVGMANATSSVVICAALAAAGGGRLTSIDPFQPTDYKNHGVDNVARAGFAARHQLIAEPNFVALPRLVGERRRFNLVFIDGWHSFDHAMLDIFYGDLLLVDGGVLAVHDTDCPSVYKAVRFLETHKPYDRLSPAPAIVRTGLGARAARRVRTALGGRRASLDARARRTQWRTLSAYRKIRTELTPEALAAAF
jgi:predicted O-methyltransferase YrrM